MPRYIETESFEKSVLERYCKPCQQDGRDYHGVKCRACEIDDMLCEVADWMLIFSTSMCRTQKGWRKKMKPILFNSDAVRAILAGKKTQTRRIVKSYLKENFEIDTDGHTVIGIYNQYDGFVHPILDYAPYIPGDILYVRETWSKIISPGEFEDRIDYVYKATDKYPFGKDGYIVKFRWHPSIHMPKEAARIFLRVTNVRVERLQNIQSMDAIAEGAEAEWHRNDCGDAIYTKTPIDTFAKIWDKTIKPGDLDRYGWYANPWVWVIEFERIEKEKTE